VRCVIVTQNVIIFGPVRLAGKTAVRLAGKTADADLLREKNTVISLKR
jgi:hypothetical protein